MSYVSRDGNSNITGVFNVLQPGIAEERLSESDPEVIAFRSSPPPPSKSSLPLTAEELATHLITRNIITRGEVDAIKAAR